MSVRPAQARARPGAASLTAMTVLAALGLSTPIPAGAQWWLDVPDNAPRTADGEPDLMAPAPRLEDGTPDFSGIWFQDTNKFTRDIAADLGADAVPFQPWARALYEERATGAHSREDPDANCLPQGVPKISFVPAPWKVVQQPDLIVVIYEAFTLWRQIFMDGRRLADGANPTWLGYSTGHWDGDTLVVDSAGFNGKIWLDQLGKPTTEQLRVTERFRRTDFGHMEIEATIDDPGAYTRPWTVKQTYHLLPETELLEFICNENNQDLEHLPSSAD
jgi:hypothetical protein